MIKCDSDVKIDINKINLDNYTTEQKLELIELLECLIEYQREER